MFLHSFHFGRSIGIVDECLLRQCTNRLDLAGYIQQFGFVLPAASSQILSYPTISLKLGPEKLAGELNSSAF